MPSKLHFRVSSGLKDIIGRELITDDEIAVFELVKNSYDAHAGRVDVIFENIYDEHSSKITIKDNGKGMSLHDIENKWLFVAYSAKKEGTEDDDYREKIYQHRAFAGAKGIGRFSCDRLGKTLKLYTTREEADEVEIITTDWEVFEKNLREQFATIPIPHSSKPKPYKSLKKGTILEISSLRSQWYDRKIDRLYNSLAKLIHPSDTVKDFAIYLTCEELGMLERPVENFIFEALEIKTTTIDVTISEDGEFIITELKDGGTQIYKIREKNTYAPLIHNVSIKAFYLNQSAKLTFSHRMGVNTRDYGSIFLYKNNIRIYPFGEPGEDTLRLDSRKSQKPSLYIGNKDLIGRISITGPNTGFIETSSRGSGFIRNETFAQFEEFVMEKVITRLEKYVIDVQKWGNGSFLSIEDELVEDDKDQIKNRITDLISKLTNSQEIVDFEYSEGFLNIIDESQAESATSLVKNLFRLAKASGNESLLDFANRTEKRVDELFVAFEEAKDEAAQAVRTANRAQAKLKEKESENLFLKSVKSQDLDEVISFMHAIGISATTTDNYLSAIYQKLNQGIEIKPAELKKAIEVVSFENRKILSITRFSTKANFKLYAEEITTDIVEFVKEYTNNILIPLRGEDIEINLVNQTTHKYIKTFKPIELSILMDNLLSNSIRAKAERLNIILETSEHGLALTFEDNGKGIKDENVAKIFSFGFTTTSGSGLGLFHVSEIVEHLRGSIKVDNKTEKGVKFILTI